MSKNEPSPQPVLEGDRPEERNALRAAGAVAGLVGAMLMAGAATLVARHVGDGDWSFAQLVAAVLLRGRALHGGLPVDLMGLGIHLCLGVGLGAFYGTMVPLRRRRADVFGLPLVYTLALFGFMTYFVISWTDPVMYHHLAKGWFLLVHLPFAVALYLTVPLGNLLLAWHDRRERGHLHPGAGSATP